MIINNSGQLIHYEAQEGNATVPVQEWTVNSAKRHAFRLYSDFELIEDSTECLKPQLPEQQILTVENFSNNGLFFRTKSQEDGFGGEDVCLDLDDRIITFLLDQSGSMTWNDDPRLRHTVARRIAQRAASTYPGDLTFNVLKFRGSPVQSTLFGVVETDEIEGDDVQTVSNTFFQDDESNFAGVRVVRKFGDFPDHPLDGDIVAEGFLNKVADTPLEENREHFYKVFTFDKNSHFSSGVPIKATPRQQEIPFSVANFSSDVLIGTGVARDDNTIGLWHFDEGSGNRFFDFSDSNTPLLWDSESPLWLSGVEDIPIGLASVRFNGVNSGASTELASSKLSLSDKATFMFWVYPYNTSSSSTILARQNDSETNYLIKQNSSGGIEISIDGSTFAVSDPNILSEKIWNHVAITVDLTSNNVDFFIGGVVVSTGSFVSTSTNSTDDMFFDVGFDRRGSESRFFGKLTEVSIHNAVRDQSFIEEAAIPVEETKEGEIIEQDNEDRLVVVSFDIPEDLTFPGGIARIVRNEFSVPSWEEDGDIIANIPASPGKVVFADTEDFVLGKIYNYRLFTRNSIGNFSFPSDSPLIEVSIPEGDLDLDDLVPSLSAPTNLQQRSGNKKVFLKWKNIKTDDRIARVEVYFSEDQFPVIDDNSSSDELVFEGDINAEQFVHRGIPNGQRAFYTIVSRDRLGRSSAPINILAIPTADADEIGIPLLEVENINYEIINNNGLSIGWDNPIKFIVDFEAFFDQRVLIYAALTDEFGRELSDDVNITLNIKNTQFRFEEQAEDVFGNQNINIDELSTDSFFNFSVSRESNGILKGALKMTDDLSRLALLEEANFEIEVFSSIPDPESPLDENGNPIVNLFEFHSEPVSVKMKAPFKMDLSNRDERFITQECPSEEDILGKENKKVQSFTGAYIRSENPFVARVELSFRDEALPVESFVKASVWDASADLCSENSEFVRIQPSSTVAPPSSTLPVVRGLVPAIDEKGREIEDEFEEKTFVDIPLSVPNFPQKAILFVQASFAGYTLTRRLDIVMQNILNVEVNAEAPIGNGIDTAEQFANVFLIDPDFPEDEDKRTTVTDLTVVKWSLENVMFGADRPFYSVDSVPTAGGVFSRVRNGVARNIILGPASDVETNFVETSSGNVQEVGEVYKVKAAVVFDGLVGNGDQEIEIRPLQEDPSSLFGPRLLMEFPDFKNVIWSDGQDFQKLIISKDPNNPSDNSKVVSCFKECLLDEGVDITPLQTGQIVRIKTGEDVEIIHGKVQEALDPYDPECTKDLIIDDEEGFVSKGSAFVEIDEDKETVVYFRINKFFKPLPADEDCPQEEDNQLTASNLLEELEDDLLNPCECLGIKKDEPIDKLCTEIDVTGTSTLLFNNEPITLRGGGSMEEGLPPTILVPREPLDIRIAQKKVNGLPSDTFIIDGESINEIIVEVSFAGCPVPDGTPVEVTIDKELSETSQIKPRATTVFTKTGIDETIDSINARSFASVTFDPVSIEGSIDETIRFLTNFDKSGDIERERTVCARVNWEPADNPLDVTEEQKGLTSVFSENLFAYNTTSDSWLELASMNTARSYPVFEFVSDKAYSIGGLDQKTISKIVEEYDPSIDSWKLKSTMPTPRFGAMSAVFDSKIYVIGGITGGNFGEPISVSKAVEVYDPSTDSWSVLSSMPVVDDETVGGKDFGVVFGNAQLATVGGEDRIYVLSGLTNVDQNGNISSFSDRVIYYKIASDEWVVLDAFEGDDLSSYRRASPTSFIEGSGVINVHGGVTSFSEQKGRGIKLAADSYSYDPASDAFEINDFDFSEMPSPRQRAALESFGDDHFIIGGSDLNSQTLNIVEKLDSSTSPFSLEDKESLPRARTGVGVAGATLAFAPFNGDSHVFVVGGFSSGRSDGFLQFVSESSPQQVRLDGRQSAMINFSLKDESGNPPNKDVKVIVRGFLKFTNAPLATVSKAEEEQTDEFQQTAEERLASREAIYPVLFTTQNLTTVNGQGIITLKPRGDDILEGAEEIIKQAGIEDEELNLGEGETGTNEVTLVINTGETRTPYDILIQMSIVDDFYFGQTVEVLPEDAAPDAEEEDQESDVEEDSDEDFPSSTESCDNIQELSTSISWQSFSIGIPTVGLSAFNNLNTSKNTLTEQLSGSQQKDSTDFQFSLVNEIKGQSASPIFSYFIDIDWVPIVEKVLANNDASIEEALEAIDNIRNEIPFGASALFDAIISVSRILSDNDADGLGKVVYTFTDNESNLSVSTVEDVIEEVNSIDGQFNSPIAIGNFSVVSPITVSAKANSSDTDDINRLATDTGGQSITVLSEDFENEIVSTFIGSAVGSLGFGTYEKIVDLGEIVELKSITVGFELFENTTGSWSISVSEDGHSFTPIRGEFKPNELIEFDRNGVRFIKFSIILRTGFSASDLPEYELIPLPGSPCLKDITITFEKSHEDELFLNTENVDGGPQQVVVSVNASKVDHTDIVAGVAKSASHNFEDYFNDAQPQIFQNGKIFVPIRSRDTEETLEFEPLEKVDQYTYRAKFGKWDPNSEVIVLDSNNNPISTTEYKAYPRQGIIVFSFPRKNQLSVKIINEDSFRVGFKLFNRASATALEICGLGFMYNKNQELLSPIEKLPPEVINPRILPSEPGVYDAISLDYLFQDPNGDKEDLSKIEIKWFINSVHRPELDNLLSWNNISDINDPIFRLAFTFNLDDLDPGQTVIDKARELNQSLLKVGDLVHFTIRVSDGVLLSEKAKSNVVEILEAPPSITFVRIRSLKDNGIFSDVLTSEDTAIVEFNQSSDIPDVNAEIAWFVNGEEFKRGVLGVDENADRILPGEESSNTSGTFTTGDFGLRFNNSLFVQVTPQTSTATGDVVTSETILVSNTKPSVENVTVGPSNPRSTQNLVASFEFVDFDIQLGDPQQSNQSTIQWFVSASGGDFTEVTELAGESVVPSSSTNRGQRWKAIITPFDGLDEGEPVESNIVQIL